MKDALVLACGNSLRGDDGIALFLARYLRAGFCDPQTEIASVQQWTPELAERISHADIVVFIDASRSIPPGVVHTERIVPSDLQAGSFTHSPSPAGLLALAQQLYGRIPEDAFLVGIGGQSFEHSNQFSAPVRQAIPTALNQIKAVLSGVSFSAPLKRSQTSSS
jgi:hydrogenase maturation protease